ncbi:hypothetical protein LTS18_002160, partial [Coniosporium uncinatum]
MDRAQLEITDVERVEKRATSDDIPSPENPYDEAPTTSKGIKGYLKAFERQLVAYNIEVRGIQRVEPHERHDLRTLGYTQIALLWCSFNLTAI